MLGRDLHASRQASRATPRGVIGDQNATAASNVLPVRGRVTNQQSPVLFEEKDIPKEDHKSNTLFTSMRAEADGRRVNFSPSLPR
jgi:hypothetical protein